MDLYAALGNTTDQVITHQNTAGVRTPILEVSAERGTFTRLLNHVAKGSETGLPVYFTLKDSAGNLLSMNTSIRFEAEGAGMSDSVKVSEEVETINHWQNNDLTTQRNVDNVDASKIELRYPEISPKNGERDHVDIKDTDTLYVTAEAAEVVDWSKSEWYFDSNAVENHGYGR